MFYKFFISLVFLSNGLLAMDNVDEKTSQVSLSGQQSISCLYRLNQAFMNFVSQQNEYKLSMNPKTELPQRDFGPEFNEVAGEFMDVIYQCLPVLDNVYVSFCADAKRVLGPNSKDLLPDDKSKKMEDALEKFMLPLVVANNAGRHVDEIFRKNTTANHLLAKRNYEVRIALKKRIHEIAKLQFLLAGVYESGKNFPQDFLRARDLYRLALKSGNKQAGEALKNLEHKHFLSFFPGDIMTSGAVDEKGCYCLGVSDEDAIDLAGILEDQVKKNYDMRLSRITSIEHSEGYITDTGFTALAQALKKNPYVTKLVINDGDCTDESLKVLADVLKDNASLIYIELKDHPFSDVGAAAILKALQNNITLKKIVLGKKAWRKKSPLCKKISEQLEINLSANSPIEKLAKSEYALEICLCAKTLPTEILHVLLMIYTQFELTRKTEIERL